ncbi:MAG: 3-oxoacyl-[acyl-carrier-protein] synthase III C-terminal domain-containing protein [Thermoprotei archaeon]
MAKIVEMGFYIPETKHTYTHISAVSGLPPEVVRDKLGLLEKPVETRLELEEMAYRGLRPLVNAERAERINVVIYSGSDAKGKMVWTLAPKVGYTLGLKHYYGFDVSAQCVGGLVGLHLASKLVGASGYALLSVATRQSWIVDYSDPSSTFMYDFSDGAMGALIAEDEGLYDLLSSSFLSDGWFGDVVYAENSHSKLAVHEVDGWRERMKSESKKNFVYVVEDALAHAGVSSTKIDFVGLVHMKRSFHRELLASLGVDEQRSIYLENYGHMQGVDPFLALHLGVKRRMVKRGDIVVLASAGTGWTWGASVLEVV